MLSKEKKSWPISTKVFVLLTGPLLCYTGSWWLKYEEDRLQKSKIFKYYYEEINERARLPDYSFRVDALHFFPTHGLRVFSGSLQVLGRVRLKRSDLMGVTVVMGLLSDWRHSSDEPCGDMFLCALWIPVWDLLHRRSFHHCNQKLDMSILVMDGPPPPPAHAASHVPGVKNHLCLPSGSLAGFMSHHHRLFCSLSRKWQSNCVSSPSLLTGLTLSATKLHVSTLT